ncbi:MAG: anti-sigma factor antagonist [Solirubrobacteraceae bacterium]|nr:anti-sigma factor antagonist [Solirubrobacteraceae bacterium]
MAVTAAPPRPGGSPFRVDVHPERDVVRVAPAGELDLATVGELEAELRQLRDSGFERVVLDLRKLIFMDSTGVKLILAEDRCARENGHDFSLINGPPPVRRILELTGIAGYLSFEG